jgi:hypothetical protein
VSGSSPASEILPHSHGIDGPYSLLVSLSTDSSIDFGCSSHFQVGSDSFIDVLMEGTSENGDLIVKITLRSDFSVRTNEHTNQNEKPFMRLIAPLSPSSDTFIHSFIHC